MKYGNEPWYKLFLRESTEDKLLPALNRSLRDHLLRLAKSREDGTVLRKTENPGADIARAIGAHAEEVTLIEGYVKSMLDDGYLSHKKGRLFITKFTEAQNAKSDGARRQDKWRKGGSGAQSGDEPETVDAVTEVTGGDVSVVSRETSLERRGEKKREETRRGDEIRAGARDPRAGWLARSVEKPRIPGAAPEPRHDPLDEKISFRQWAASQQMLDWAKEKRLPDPKFDKALTELRDKVRGIHDLGFWDTKAIAFIEQAISWHAKPPGAAEHDKRKADPTEYVPSAATQALMGGLVRNLR